ncbi:unnamed protein product [Caenorhabditis angaria]|uniref:Solute-binding protein family 3/N-terminal domain-containing protein n=1 Tax=Caenorhabditis angaria TaxID=860376 RepID=A0A9P1IA08_9PELO|nr:unnamed protein product [Caenorhabditis angaria]
MPHLKIAVDSSLNNKGSKFKIRQQVGLEIEQCETLMKALKWTYEFVHYHNQIGHVMQNGTATGMLGDIQSGKIDMACGRFRMTPDRVEALKFTYPTEIEVNQVYLINDPQKSEDIGFLFRPFSTYVWLLISVTIVIVSLIFFVLRFVEFSSMKEDETMYSCVHTTIAQMLSSTFNVEIRIHRKSNFFAYHFFSAIWLLCWFHVFIDYYTSELSGMLVVSDKKQMPFDDFYGFIHQLRKGTYRLLTTSPDRLPECPPDISSSTCSALFSEILSQNSPVFGDSSLLNDPEFVKNQKVPVVGFGWYPGQRISSKFSIFTQESFKSSVWLIKDFAVCPAGFIVRPKFSYLSDLNDAIIRMLPAFATIDNHYTPSYPVLSLFEKPAKSSFTLNQLSSIFVFHFSASFLASMILLAEIILVKFDMSRQPLD